MENVEVVITVDLPCSGVGDEEIFAVGVGSFAATLGFDVNNGAKIWMTAGGLTWGEFAVVVATGVFAGIATVFGCGGDIESDVMVGDFLGARWNSI